MCWTVTGDREGCNDKWQDRDEAPNRETRKESKSETAGGRHREDRQRQPVAALEEEHTRERANQEEGKQSPGEGKQSPGDDGRRQ